MAKLIDWIRRNSTRLLDPDRDVRLSQVARQLEKTMVEKRDSFDLQESLSSFDIPPRDHPLIIERVYELALRRAWRDQKITDKERAALQWIARRLNLDSEHTAQIERTTGAAIFQAHLAKATSDGILTAKEIATLQRIATDMGTTTRELVATYFSNEGEAFLRGMFAAMTETGTLDDRQWNSLVSATAGLGFPEEELQTIILTQAERFTEHVLADAKSDEYLSESERATLNWLLDRLSLSPQFRNYVKEEVHQLQRLTKIKDGHLPTVRATRVALRAGEIVHFQGYGRYEQVRHLKSGVRVDAHEGQFTITDSRLVFSGETKSFDITHRRALDILSLTDGVQIRTSGKGTGNYYFGRNKQLVHAIYQAAVSKANQTLLQKKGGLPSRHIKREVRQRVWQKYGGACAECGATQYLEFDHIIPVAKGGTGTESNVQMLCRGCNLKKSDRI